MIRFALAVMFLAVVAAPAMANGSNPFRAQGNEPFWSLIMSDDTITFQPMDGAAVTVKPAPAPRREGKADVYEAAALTLTVAEKICNDTMSGMPFPRTVTVTSGGKTFTGCGGEPASLLHGDWQITAIEGKPVAAGSAPSVKFGEDGKINGNGSCNRFFGGYSLTGEGLTAGPLASTKMMCEQALMAQERAVMEILEGLSGFAIADDGTLTLRARDGRTMTARAAG
ncbi:MAG: META domain-containing protein [Aestuariivirga sp.]|uniref:META domain-containing protein n=1 Tax=Aestuariivirga sp. TaxID=2650926 RepID=UPI0038D0ACBB